MHGERVWRSARPEMPDDLRDEAHKHSEPDQRHIGREEFSVRRMARGEWRSRPRQNLCGGARGRHGRLDGYEYAPVYSRLCWGAKTPAEARIGSLATVRKQEVSLADRQKCCD